MPTLGNQTLQQAPALTPTTSSHARARPPSPYQQPSTAKPRAKAVMTDDTTNGALGGAADGLFGDDTIYKRAASDIHFRERLSGFAFGRCPIRASWSFRFRRRQALALGGMATR